MEAIQFVSKACSLHNPDKIAKSGKCIQIRMEEIGPHFSSHVQPKTILLQYKSIVFGWTYELICEEKKSLYYVSVTKLSETG